MQEIHPPSCTKCAGATVFRILIAEIDDQPELHVFQCSKCTRLETWLRAGDRWQLRERPRLRH